MQRKKLEKEIQEEILITLNSLDGASFDRISNVPVFNRVTGGYQRPNKFQPNGISDIIGVYHGKFIAIEVKTPAEYNWNMAFLKRIGDYRNYSPQNKKESRAIDQMIYIDNKIKNGGCGFFTYSVEHTLKKLGEI